MTLSQFLSQVAAKHGAASLEGGMVFAMLQRPLDELISHALSNGPYHPGRPSPWSHCFMLAEPFKGPTTKILDCTIRDPAQKVLWNATLAQTLGIVFNSVNGAGAGAIYDGTVGDYDDPHVTARGLKWLPGLSPLERGALVAEAHRLQQQKYAYDLPGLARELVRLLSGIALPPADLRLFCSAFLQKAYRAALGPLADFNGDLRDEDTTPDDIWYSPKGLALVSLNEATPIHLPATAKLFGASADPKPVAGMESGVAPANTRQEIERVLAALKAHPKELADRERIRITLESALSQLNRAVADGALGQSSATMHPDDFDLSLVLSAIGSPKDPAELGLLYGRDLAGFHQYEDLDAKWIASLWNRLTRSKVKFPEAKRPEDVVYPIPDATTIAIAGDWGTGNLSSQKIAAEIGKLQPDYTIHLGDVYYSGTESEESDRFVKLWPAGSKGSLALNSNHEMYSGGHGYFGVALPDKKFRMQRGYSYFGLSNKTWLILGLDSAHGSSGMYAKGVLNDEQVNWLRAIVGSDVARSGPGRKNLIVLTHHQGIELDGVRTGLFEQLTSALGQGPNRWYWGHVHGVAAFKPINLLGATLRARLVGHGGVPYGADALTPAISWTESELANDAQIPQRARNGFAFLKFSDEGLEESFYDELGNVRWREP
jgi:hypothetical protein